jgi:predicted nuclease of restriction endonuclease-like (RecB) superfamily
VIVNKKINPEIMIQEQFTDIIQLIKQSRSKAIAAVNTEMINLYWNIGQYIYNRIETAEWGKSIVKELADFLQKREPDLKGFSDANLWRMRQFYEIYKDTPKLAPLVREINWSNNLIIFSRCKTMEEREFYLSFSKRENYSKRELERQISSSLFERTMIGNSKLAPLVREIHPEVNNTFKDSYIFDFLNLPESYSENELQQGLIKQMKNFILELGKDFIFIDEEYKLQVGNSDFYIDILFYHRGL